MACVYTLNNDSAEIIRFKMHIFTRRNFFSAYIIMIMIIVNTSIIVWRTALYLTSHIANRKLTFHVLSRVNVSHNDNGVPDPRVDIYDDPGPETRPAHAAR